MTRIITVNAPRSVTGNGWRYRFPNGWDPSVARQPGNAFHFEIYLGTDADAKQFAVDHGGSPDGLISNLTTEQATAIVDELAAMPYRTTDDINGA